jgi:hypothetical protein
VSSAWEAKHIMPRQRPVNLISPQRETIIRYLLTQDSPELQKRGLQQLCAAAEAGRHPYQRRAVVNQIANFRFSPHIKVRRWQYKAIGFLQPDDSKEYLTFQIANGEQDPENLSWATSALFAVAPEPYAREVASRTSRFTETHLELSAQLFDRTSYSPASAQQLMLFDLENSELSAKWYCLLFAYGRTDNRLPKLRYPSLEVVNEFTRHHDPEVSEYAIWGLWRNRAFSNTPLPFKAALALTMSSPGVRRWAYRLLAKTAASFRANVEVFREAIRIEKDEHAREGLALALVKHFDSSLSQHLVAWFVDEPSLVVRVALLEHFSRFAHRCKLYEGILIRIVRGEDVETQISSTLVVALASESGAKSVRQAVAQASRQLRPPDTQMVINYNGDIFMSSEKRTVINRTGQGSIRVESINVGQSYAQSARVRSESSELSPELCKLLESYLKAVQASQEVDAATKEIAVSAVADIQNSAKKQTPETRRLTIRKAILALEGLATAVPKATAFIENTKELVKAARSVFGI